MPPPPGMDAGPAPPPRPRVLPKGFAKRVGFTHNWMLLIGLGCCFMGLTMIGALLQRLWAGVLPVLLFAAGIGCVVQGVKKALRVLDAFRNGVPIKGLVSSVKEDGTTTVNGKHPWIIVYTFEMEGHPRQGRAVTFDAETANRLWGKAPVWVLAVEGNPERNTLYPPVK